MKTNILIFETLLFLLVIFFSACKEKNNNSVIEQPSADCLDCSFTENYLKNIKDANIFFVKGIASDTVKHGRYIDVIEDYKGNFDDKSSIFLWGGGNDNCIESNRWDIITQYNVNDTLIIIIKKIEKLFDCDIESLGDYSTITCSHSVLKLSNNYVTGYILPYWEKKDFWWVNMTEEELYSYVINLKTWEEGYSLEEDTMSFEELQAILKLIKQTNL
jgi:hypothetical protein